jgi:hypothetical protein
MRLLTTRRSPFKVHQATTHAFLGTGQRAELGQLHMQQRGVSEDGSVWHQRQHCVVSSRWHSAEQGPAQVHGKPLTAHLRSSVPSWLATQLEVGQVPSLLQQ